MSVLNSSCAPLFEPQWLAAAVTEPQWYAVHTRARHEKSVVNQLERRGVKTFLPLTSEVHRWSDRRKVVELPLFSCYVFVNMQVSPELWYQVIQTTGVLRFVGNHGVGVAIPDDQVGSIRAVLSSNIPYALCPFLKVGQRVRIRGGALDGIEGLLTARNGDRTLVISVEPIQRSIAVRIDQYQVDAV